MHCLINDDVDLPFFLHTTGVSGYKMPETYNICMLSAKINPSVMLILQEMCGMRIPYNGDTDSCEQISHSFWSDIQFKTNCCGKKTF